MSDGLPIALPTAAGQHEAKAFRQLRQRVLSALWRETVRRTWFRLVLILAFSVVLWSGLFWLFFVTFYYLKQLIPLGAFDQTVRTMFSMFFASLLVMLVFSAGVILYGLLFRSRETAFLLGTPVRAERIFIHKFQEATFFSSWGFVLLGSPSLLAYGVVAHASWCYYAMLLPFIMAFVYIPNAIGALACLGIVRFAPRRRLLIVVALGVLFVGSAIGFLWAIANAPEQTLFSPEWLQGVMGRLQFAEQRILPNWWLSAGLLEAAHGGYLESGLYLAVLVSNALLLRLLAVWAAGASLRRAYDALFNLPSRRRRRRTALLGRTRFSPGRLLPVPMRLLMAKDLRLFRRDPMQWAQFLVFLGLLLLYFTNVRHFGFDRHYADKVNLISFLNLTVIGLLLSTFNTRFIFPMISLEGRRFWILGLLPLRRETLLWSKFFFSAASVIPAALLVLLSDLMLEIAPLIVASHQLTCLLLAVGLSGIAVGFGAMFPNLREESPARIAAGVGGTLNLVISTLYIAAIVLMTALPFHFYYFARANFDKTASLDWYFNLFFYGGTAASIALTLAAAIVPMRMGFRAFRKMEF